MGNYFLRIGYLQYINPGFYGFNYKISPDRGWKSRTKERPKLPCVDFIFDWGSQASRVEPSILSEVLISSQRLSSQRWIIFEDPRPSCSSIPLRGSCHKMDTIFGGASPAYLRGCKIEGHLWQSSSILRPGEVPVMMWHCFAVGIGGLCSYYMFLGEYAPEATFADEKSPTTNNIYYILENRSN